MKKSIFAVVFVLFVTSCLFGQIVTNTNQSAQYIRLLARNGSTDIDAAYYNPAGLISLDDGWHFSLSNQTIFQEKTVENFYPLLNQSKYVGEVNVPFFPNAYAAFKSDKLVFSVGFGPNAGGGSADFKTGLPSFEIPFSGLPPTISGFGLPTTAYSADIAFKGTSIFLGFQANVTYAFSDEISLAGGVRYIKAENTYEGYIKDVMVNAYHPLLNPQANMISAAGFFNSIGQPGYAAQVADKEVDVKQTGTAMTPILSLCIQPNDDWSIGIRYEFKTKLELENETVVDGTGMFPDGVITRNDIPAVFSIGTEYQIMRNVRGMISYNLFFEKDANLGGSEAFIDSNTYDLGFGLEWSLTDSFLLSGGILYSKVGVSPEYQSDFAHEISATTFGGGARLVLSKQIDLDLGAIFVQYQDANRFISYAGVGSIEERYSRSTWAFSGGLNFHF